MSWPSAAPVDDHGHGHGHGVDNHLWLNPNNAVVLAEALAERLGQLRPDLAGQYRDRAEAFARRMASLDQTLMAALAPVSERGFAVYHDGYRHFVEHYGLRQLDYVSVTPELTAGAKHLYHLEQALRDQAACLFVEPYADTTSARQLGERLGLGVSELDPLASNRAVESYDALMRGLADTMLACLLGDQR